MYLTEPRKLAGVGKRRRTPWDRVFLLLGFAVVAGLAVMSCSSHRSPAPTVPTPPSVPAPPSTPAPMATPEKSSTSSDTESSETGKGSKDPSRVASDTSEAQPPPMSPEGRRGDSTAGGESAAGGTQTAEEREEGLDRKLDSSLTEFDGLLLKEQELLEARRESAGGELMGSGGGATGEEESGSEVSGGPQTGGDDRAYAQSGASGGSPDAPPGEPSEPGASVGGEETETGSDRIPPDVGDGSDDDIVARQLREAAEKEDDPELREKLWEEYRAYKKGMKKEI